MFLQLGNIWFCVGSRVLESCERASYIVAILGFEFPEVLILATCHLK